MPAIDLHLNGDGVWPDLEGKLNTPQVIHLTNLIGMALLLGGMQSGLPSVTLRLNLPDGRIVLAETSLRALVTAVDAMKVKALMAGQAP